MTSPRETCWSLVRRAANGDGPACSVFAGTYLGVVRGFFHNRWRGTPALAQVDDAVQEVFLDLFRSGGALARVEPGRVNNFRSFLFGVTHKVALRHEERLGRARANAAASETADDELVGPDPTMSRAFDRQWARRMVQRARERQAALAKTRGEDAARRVELLRLRFGEGMPIRDIAKQWDEPAERVHREFAKARKEFKEALRAEVAFHVSGPASLIEAECRNLLTMLE